MYAGLPEDHCNVLNTGLESSSLLMPGCPKRSAMTAGYHLRRAKQRFAAEILVLDLVLADCHAL